MTILVKANTAGKRPPGDTVLPMVADPQVKKGVRTLPPMYTARYTVNRNPMRPMLLLMSVLSLVVMVLLMMTAGFVVNDFINRTDVGVRYRCAISSTKDSDYIVLNETPVKTSWFGLPTVQMQVFSSSSDLIDARLMGQLLEDLAIEDTMETISVRDGQRTFEIVHDFDDNLTSIRSPERCFLMDMIHEFVLEPSSLIASFQNESRLELSHAHTTFRALLPPAHPPAHPPALAQACLASARPVYRLSLEDSLVLKKRSVEVLSTPAPPAPSVPSVPSGAPEEDFVQFSGSHVQRITIANMRDVLRYETAGTRE